MTGHIRDDRGAHVLEFGQVIFEVMVAPGFCRPTAFTVPAGHSAVRTPGLPSHGTGETPFVVTAPSWLTS